MSVRLDLARIEQKLDAILALLSEGHSTAAKPAARRAAAK